jgi:hypothetical protein
MRSPALPPMADTAASHLEPGTASKVLQADLRNTVAQVAAGQRLPEADRSRLETTVLTGADPDTVAHLARERQANLLKIWASGRRRLTASELKELEPILPGEILARQPIARAGYQHPYAHYCEIYQVAERTIKHWVGVGREATPEADLPPLDDPPRMKDWYARRKKNRVPDRLVTLASTAAQLAAGPSSAPCGAGTTTPAPAAGLPAGQPSLPAGTAAGSAAGSQAAAPASPATRGYSATLERLRQAEATAGERYTALILDPDKQDQAEQARRSWQLLTKELRAYEKDAEEVLQKSGQSWVAAEVVAVIHELHVPLRDGMLSLYDRIESQLDGLSRTERKRLYRSEVRRLFAGLITNRFTALPPGFLEAPPSPAAPVA